MERTNNWVTRKKSLSYKFVERNKSLSYKFTELQVHGDEQVAEMQRTSHWVTSSCRNKSLSYKEQVTELQVHGEEEITELQRTSHWVTSSWRGTNYWVTSSCRLQVKSKSSMHWSKWSSFHSKCDESSRRLKFYISEFMKHAFVDSPSAKWVLLWLTCRSPVVPLYLRTLWHVKRSFEP